MNIEPTTSLPDNNNCFIITPIDSENSQIRREVEGVISSAIKPLLDEFGLKLVVAHKISSPGSINNQVISHIVNDKLVIANLTDLNPNVMYELAIRHVTKKPVIHICRHDTDLPFDIKAERALFYRNDMQGALELKDGLKKFIAEALSKDEWDDNPIYNAVKFDYFSKLSATSTDSNLNEYLFNVFQAIQDDLKQIKRSIPNEAYADMHSLALSHNHRSLHTLHHSKLDINKHIVNSHLTADERDIK